MNSPKTTPKLVQQWNSTALVNKTIKSQIEKTWILLKSLAVPGIGEFQFKAGNKDYHLSPSEPTSGNSDNSDDPPNDGGAVNRQYKSISELGLKRKYRYLLSIFFENYY